MDKIIPKNEDNFSINDIELSIDPTQISVYKEGLNYSYKTLRTKASSKIVNGNSIFHLKLRLVFTKEMLLELHRLICQTRNIPYVQIVNKFVSDTVSSGSTTRPVYFTVNSFQITPRPDSPHTVDVELDLRYFNHKIYSGESLLYKKYFETTPYKKEGKNYIKSFDVFSEDKIIELEYDAEVNSSQSIRRSKSSYIDSKIFNISEYNFSIPVSNAKRSYSFIRYSNFLQIKSLRDNFAFDESDLRTLLGFEVNQRDCKAIHSLNNKYDIIEEILRKNPFYELEITYQKYYQLKLNKRENKQLRKFFDKNLRGVEDYEKRIKKAKELKQEITTREEFASIQGKLEKIEKDATINIYTGRQNVNNVFYVSKKLSAGVKRDAEGNVIASSGLEDEIVSNFSCGFSNIVSSIPVSGQEFPAHQFLGSSEPMFNVNIVAIGPKNEKGYAAKTLEFEEMRKTLQENAKDYKIVPDSAFFAVDSFFTKLLGCVKQFEVDALSNKPVNNFILRNYNVSTVEGMPGTQSLQFSFSETNSFVEEQIRPVYTFGASETTTKQIESKLKLYKGSIQGRKRSGSNSRESSKTAADTSYKYLRWMTRYFSSQEYYRSWVAQGYNLNEVTKEQDKNAYDLCMNVLDPIQERLNILKDPKSIYIMSSIDKPSTGKRKTSSRHYSGGAVDVSVKGMSAYDLMRIIRGLETTSEITGNIGVIGYYPNKEVYPENKMKSHGQKSNFVHIDSRYNVQRISPSGVTVTNKAQASTSDTFEILKTQSGTFYAFDINDRLYKNIEGETITGILDGGDAGEILEEEEQTNDATEEADFEVEDIISNPDLKEKINKRINPFFEESFDFTGNIEVSRLKDLEEDIQTKIQSSLSLNTLNPELQVRVLNNNKYPYIAKSLNEQNIKYTIVGDKLYIPKTANNITIVKENMEAKALLKLYENLSVVASIMLTEPELYLEDPTDENVQKEIRRIKEEVDLEDVEPYMLCNFLRHMQIIREGDSYLLSGIEVGGALLAAGGSAFKLKVALASSVAAPAAPFIAAGALLASLGYEAITVSQINSQKAGREVYSLGAIYLLARLTKGKAGDLIAQFNKYIKGKNIKEDISTSNLFAALGDSDTVMNAFNQAINYGLTDSLGFSEFEEGALALKSNTKLLAALGNISEIKNAGEKEDFKLKGLAAEELFVGELREIFRYSFGYPYVEDFGRQEDFQDLFEVDENKVEPEYSKERYVGNIKDYYISSLAFEQNFKDFPLTKAELKTNQDKKIGYIRFLKQTILESLANIPVVKSELNIIERAGINNFEESNTYPDIILPADPANIEGNHNLHPGFYYYRPNENKRFDYINPIMKKNIEKIVTKSLDFSQALSEGIFTGEISEQERSRESAKLNISGYSDYERILIDREPLQGEDADTVTDVTPIGQAINIDKASFINDQLESYKKIRSSFDGMFGGALQKADIKKENKNLKERSGFKSPEEVIKDTIDGCRNLMRPKKDIKKAFPTFKLYFIEEDYIESGRLNVFDDFYSFSGVKSFTVFSNKHLPASTAVIQLQNISGVLDGTKPEVVRDIDVDQDLTPEEESLRQSSISSIVVRPGINIQLRAGYESNSNKLDIIFTGRITEVKNSSAGELLEVTAQSFGTELIAKKHGVTPADPIVNKKFYNTHSLLGTLALSEELKHFGRVKTGRRFQTNENKFPSLDMGTGKDESWFNFTTTSWVTDVMQKYGIYIVVSSIFLGGAGAIIRKSQSTGKIITGLKDLIGSGGGRTLNTLLQGVGSGQNASRGAKFVASALQSGLVKLPITTFQRISNLGRANALAKANLQVGKMAAMNQKKILYNASFVNKIKPSSLISKFKGVSPSLTEAQIEASLVRQYGVNFCLKYGIIANPSTLSTASILFSGVTKSFLFSGTNILRNSIGAYASATVLAGIIDVFVGAFAAAEDYVFSNKITPPKLKILLSPQDDNLYPPPPSEYLVKTNQWDAWNISKKAFFAILNANFGLIETFIGDSEKAKMLKNAYRLGDTRLSVSKSENEYTIRNSTFWEILKEMTLRHPGYLYGIRKYGSGLQSRIFFGDSTQRYFAKDLPVNEIETLNEIDSKLLVLKNNKPLEKAFIKKILKIDNNSFDDKQKTKEIIEYWISKTTERFIPYRQYHSLDSEHDIVNNGLRVESERVFNQVSVLFEEGGEERITKIRGVPYLKESAIREKAINFENCKGVASASRYGLTELANSAKEMYSGEILCIGNPKINTDDICILSDNYLNMHGMVEVVSVTHLFNHENGFLTEIQPAAIVLAKDRHSINIMSGSLVFEAHRKLIDRYTDRNLLINQNGKIDEAKLEEIAEKTVVSYFSESDSDFYNSIYSTYSNIPLQFTTDYSQLSNSVKQKIIKDLTKELKENIEEGNIIFLEDLTKNLNPRELDFVREAESRISYGSGTISGGLGFLLGKTAIGKAFGSILGFALGKEGVNAGFNLLESSFKSGNLGKNIFQDILMTQASTGQLIKILPLVKDGKPLAAGGYEYVKQSHRFKQLMGDYINSTRDSVRAIRKHIKELESDYELLGVSEYDPPFDFLKYPLSVSAEFITGLPSEAIYTYMIQED